MIDCFLHKCISSSVVSICCLSISRCIPPGVQKCSLHLLRFHFLTAFQCFPLFSSRPFFLLVPWIPMGPRAITRFLTEPLVRICYCILLLASFFIFSFLLSYHSIVGALHGHLLTVFSHMHRYICSFHMMPFNVSRCIPPVYGRPKM